MTAHFTAEFWKGFRGWYGKRDFDRSRIMSARHLQLFEWFCVITGPTYGTASPFVGTLEGWTHIGLVCSIQWRSLAHLQSSTQYVDRRKPPTQFVMKRGQTQSLAQALLTIGKLLSPTIRICWRPMHTLKTQWWQHTWSPYHTKLVKFEIPSVYQRVKVNLALPSDLNLIALFCWSLSYRDVPSQWASLCVDRHKTLTWQWYWGSYMSAVLIKFEVFLKQKGTMIRFLVGLNDPHPTQKSL